MHYYKLFNYMTLTWIIYLTTYTLTNNKKKIVNVTFEYIDFGYFFYTYLNIVYIILNYTI